MVGLTNKWIVEMMAGEIPKLYMFALRKVLIDVRAVYMWSHLSLYHFWLQGRNNLGNTFTWAAGNGGYNYDSCSADGYVQSIYTIPVGAYSQNGGPAGYDEKCSAKMTVAYVDNTLDADLQVVWV